VDGLVQLGGCRTTLVHPTPGGRGHTAVGRFKELLHLWFGPPLRSALLFELTECQRTRTVEEYANHFQALLPRMGRLDEAQRV
jgi:hypothetical protein